MDLEPLGRGGETDYVLGTQLGWGAFDVVTWSGVEALDELYGFDIVLSRRAEAGPVDVAELVDTGASFRIATEDRWRVVHGLVAEAALVEQTGSQLLYRVLLAPHLVRACHRIRCRTFVDRSLEDILTHVLENRAPKHPGGERGLLPLSGEIHAPTPQPSFDSFDEPVPRYRMALSEPERLQVARRQVVQYNESDFAFISRLLEAEGISYFFEHGETEVVMTLSDRPGLAPLFERDATHELIGAMQGGQQQRQELVRSFRDHHRLRPATVTMRDYAWRKSLTTLEASATGGAHAELEHFEFPAADEDEAVEPGRAPARFQMERYQVEASLSDGTGTVRTLEPGRRFRLEDRAGSRQPVELLVVRVETRAQQRSVAGTSLEHEQLGFSPRPPEATFYENRFVTLQTSVPYRPTRRARRPRIAGVQTARVTAEEVAGGATELNSDELSRVRVRFPWDQRPNDGTPSSKWIRVAQYWAGPAFGALYVPRVGHEVLVAFERGDPDRPIIVGRLYNAQNPPPYVEPNTTKSTLKSDSVGEDGSGADGFNELRFDDAADKEQIFLHAQRNLDEVVRACHSTSVGGDQSNSVSGNQSNSVKGNRDHTVHGTEIVEVVGNRSTIFQTNERHVVGSNRDTSVGANESLEVGGNRTMSITANESLSVGGNMNRGVVGNDSIGVSGQRSVNVKGIHRQQTDAHFESSAAGMHKFSSIGVDFSESSYFRVKAGAATLEIRDGLIVLDNAAGASVVLAGAAIFVGSGDVVSTSGAHSLSSGGSTTLLSGGSTTIGAGGDINAAAANIKLNG